jgi:DNA-binding NtrC family response regulator
MPSILVVDDDSVNVQLIAEILEQEGYEVRTTSDPRQAAEMAARESFDLAILDVRMPALDGISLLKTLRSDRADLPVIVMTGFGSVDGAVEALSAGAVDYLSKPMNIVQLRDAVRRSLERAAAKAPGTIAEDDGGEIVGRSEAMVALYREIAKVAPGRSTVLLQGESGTGKELLARAIHRHSPRRDGPFLAVDCGAISEGVLESELFGHVRGAFTGAMSDKTGLFADATGGTLLLDEISNVGPAMQASLLRVLQERQVRPVGSSRPRSVDVRIVAATNRDLREAVAHGEFREDLYYRLNVVHISIPPLRERHGDIALLAQHFLQEAAEQNGRPPCSLSGEAMETLESYDWPGNVRQLEHVIERAVVLVQSGVIGVEDLPFEVRGTVASDGEALLADHPTLEQLKRRYIVQILGETGGNVSRAASILGIDRRSLYRMMTRYDITRPPSKA